MNAELQKLRDRLLSEIKYSIFVCLGDVDDKAAKEKLADHLVSYFVSELERVGKGVEAKK